MALRHGYDIVKLPCSFFSPAFCCHGGALYRGEGSRKSVMAAKTVVKETLTLIHGMPHRQLTFPAPTLTLLRGFQHFD